MALVFAGSVVFGILAEVSVRAGFGDAPGEFEHLHPLHPLQISLEFLVPFARNRNTFVCHSLSSPVQWSASGAGPSPSVRVKGGWFAPSGCRWPTATRRIVSPKYPVSWLRTRGLERWILPRRRGQGGSQP